MQSYRIRKLSNIQEIDRFIDNQLPDMDYRVIKKRLIDKYTFPDVNNVTFRGHLIKYHGKKFYRNEAWLRESIEVLINNDASLDLILDINYGHRDLKFVMRVYKESIKKLNKKPIIKNKTAIDIYMNKSNAEIKKMREVLKRHNRKEEDDELQ